MKCVVEDRLTFNAHTKHTYVAVYIPTPQNQCLKVTLLLTETNYDSLKSVPNWPCILAISNTCPLQELSLKISI